MKKQQIWLRVHNWLNVMYCIISSVRSSSGYHGLIEIRNPLFQIFQILQILKWKWKWKDPTCAIFLKSMGFKDLKYDIPVYQIKIHKYTITQIRKYTNTKCLKDPTCAIFLDIMDIWISWIFGHHGYLYILDKWISWIFWYHGFWDIRDIQNKYFGGSSFGLFIWLY